MNAKLIIDIAVGVNSLEELQFYRDTLLNKDIAILMDIKLIISKIVSQRCE